jgi:RNA polymerase-binding transcription factor DksA
MPTSKKKSSAAGPKKKVAKKPAAPKAAKRNHTGGTKAGGARNSKAPARSLKAAKSAAPQKHATANNTTPAAVLAPKKREQKLDPFTRGQKEKLLQLRDAMVDSMAGVAQDTLRSRAEGSEASAFGMHQADAGSDAYDRDFALSLLSQEQDALYEIDQALKRIELGTYGICEMSGKPISRARLEAIPFARFTVECQSQLEKQNKASRVRQSVTSLFGLTDEEGGETEEEEAPAAKSED